MKKDSSDILLLRAGNRLLREQKESWELSHWGGQGCDREGHGGTGMDIAEFAEQEEGRHSWVEMAAVETGRKEAGESSMPPLQQGLCHTAKPLPVSGHSR